MAVCHFASESAAREHLQSKGFKNKIGELWINVVAGVDARLMNSPRGWCVMFWEREPGA